MMFFSPDTPMYFCCIALELMNLYVMIYVNQEVILFFGFSKFSLSFPIFKFFNVISRLSYLLLIFCSI